ncbi:diaminopimelate epimerase [Thermohalobacter berrensis]|uniref:Diaminopimelate epimerase n=1 Tax=Thermohalobacter berrensis TaxID=99594 RepID=A0A419TA46_9FIRM|nr:diaminopimelate epimerase [Thermohalobacter berrensis]RKD34354.1 diaminopimelate epimerase [Thermohalobacter berrensis]
MLEFAKLHGLGNDFIVFDGIKQKLPSYNELAKKVCDRHFGIGADGMIIVEESKKADIKMVFFNADGTEAPMCGNGIRCFAKFVYDNNYVKSRDFTVETLAGIMRPRVYIENDLVSKVKVNLGKPIFDTKAIPVATEENKFIDKEIIIDNKKFNISAVSVGSIHAVVFVNNLDDIDIEKIGPIIENHKLFPDKINVNFCQVIDEDNIKVLTWERGVGQTLACGTGASSVAVISSIVNNTSKCVNVHLLGGTVKIEQEDDEVYMTGPAKLICTGLYNLN